MSHLTICLIICVLTMASYIWGKLPMGLTALLSMVLFIVTGCLKASTAAAYFGNANGIMIVAMFIVAAGFNRTQFVKKCAASVNKIAKGSLTRVMLGYVLIAALLSQFIQSSVIVFGIMAPLMMASCEELGLSPSKALFPMAIICIIIYCIFFATKFAPDQPVVAVKEVQTRQDNREALPPFKERAGYIIFILTTIALILQRQIGIDTWVICVSGAVAMVLFGVLTEKEAVASVNWPMAFLLVGSFAMGGALTETGAGEVVGNFLASFANKLGNRYLIGFVFFIVPFLLTQVMMNRTVMIVFIPIAILACKSLNANPIGIMILVQSACLSSFMTPMATPAVPMCMSMGGYDVKSLIKQSLLPAAILCVISVFWIMTVFPM